MNSLPKISLTADCVVFYVDKTDGKVYILLIQRSSTSSAYPNCWALPGGFLDYEETLEDCALRELFEETRVEVDPNKLHYVGVFDRVDRDPRGRVISHVFTTIVDTKVVPQAGDDAQKTQWFELKYILDQHDSHKDIQHVLAFDHRKIIAEAEHETFWRPTFNT